MEMNTAQLLEAMTDVGEFERLATAILAKTNRAYESVIHLGINASGKTVASPVDGFCRVPGSAPPCYVLVQHTTTARTGLRYKWLSRDPSNPGDLTKAGQLADGIRRSVQDAEFTVVLSTNQRLPSVSSSGVAGESHGLYLDVDLRAKEMGVEVDVWEQSRYARYLDTDRDGQYLRAQFLGTNAERLSRDLCQALSRRSLNSYKNEQFSAPDVWIRRCVVDEILHQRCGHTRLAIVRGDSGFGKSAACYQVLAEHIESGGVGLWLKATAADEAVDLEDALDRVLHQLYPSLMPGEGSRVADYAPGKQILLVIDDLRDVLSPVDLVRRVKAWCRPSCLIVLPIWPRYWRMAVPEWQAQQSLGGDSSSSAAGSSERELPEVSVHDVGPFRASESKRAAAEVARGAGVTLSELDLLQVVSELGDDPWCFGAWAETMGAGRDAGAIASAKATVDAYVTSSLDRLADSDGRLLSLEYGNALTRLADQLLRRRSLALDWCQAESWIGDDRTTLAALRAMCQRGKLCRLDADNEISFRHDRILSYFAVEALCEMLARNSPEDREIFLDPHYSWWTSEALLRRPQPEEFIDELLGILPLAVTLTIGRIGEPRTDYERMIVEKVREWVQPLGRSSNVPESVRGAVVNSFIFADSPAVLDIVTHGFGLEVNWLGDFARFRNGDAEAGVRYAALAGIGEGKPGFWEQLVQHAVQYHRKCLVRDLSRILISALDDGQIKGALALSGHLALPGLRDSIEKCWLQSASKTEHLSTALWAALRCLPSHKDDLLSLLVAHWAEMPTVDAASRDDRRQGVANRLAGAACRWATQQSVEWLIGIAQRHTELQDQVAYLCGQIDVPDAIEHAVRHWAAHDGTPWQRTVEHHWGSLGHPKLSAEAVERLHNLWDAPDLDAETRTAAFRLWLDNVGRSDADVLTVLRQVEADAPYSADAVVARARMGDTSSVSLLIDVIRKRIWCFRVAHHVWCSELRSLAEETLASFASSIPNDCSGGRENEHYALADLLMLIPEDEAESMLIAFWDHLRFSRLFVQVALFVGTQRCVAIADRAIKEFPNGENPFEHVSFRYGYGWSEASSHDRLTLDRLKLLGRYIGQFDDYAVSAYVQACCQFGQDGMDWARGHVPSEAWDRYRREHCPTDADIFSSLSGLTMNHPNGARLYVNKFISRNEEGRLLSAMRSWLREEPTTSWRRIQVAAIILKTIGTRSDLETLDVPVATEDGPWGLQQARRIVDDAAFAVRLRSLR